MERLKVYLDTNTIFGFVKEMAKADLEGRDYRKTRKIIFLHDNLDKLYLTTSFFSLMEIIDNLEKEFKVAKNRLNYVISLFKKISKIKILDRVILTGETYKWFLAGISFKDSIQVNIAKNNNLVFVSEDKKLVKGIKRFYKTSFTLRELKQILKSK